MKPEKKSCQGCFGIFFRSKKPKPKMVENYCQTDAFLLPSSKIFPESFPKSSSDTNFFKRNLTPELPGIPRYRTSIITGHNSSVSFFNVSEEKGLQTPIIHNYEPEELNNLTSIPEIFESARNKITANGLPQLVPITPARSIRNKSQNARQVITPE